MHGALLALSLLAATAGAPVESAGNVPAGTRVRVQASRKLMGQVVASDAEHLRILVDQDHTVVDVPVADIRSLHLSQGRRTRGKAALRGAGWGLLTGVTAGVALGLTLGDDHCTGRPGYWGFDCLLTFSAGEKAAALGVAGGVLGATLGALSGAVRPGEKWERLHGLRARLALQPQGRGLGVALSLAF
jgi:hypothetical protein